MSEHKQAVCLRCGGPVPPKKQTGGSPRRYCSNNCKCQAWREASEENARKHKDWSEAWQKENVGSRVAYNLERLPHRRFPRQVRAMPPWLTDEQQEQMRQLYLEARRLTAETGIRHEVDHIHPLKGKALSGLHVPWNLRIVTSTENKRKKNRLVDSLPTGQTLHTCITALEDDDRRHDAADR